MLRRLLIPAVLSAICAGPAVAREFDTTVETTHRRITWEDFKSDDKTGGRWEKGAWAHVASGIKLDPFQSRTRTDDDGRWFATALEIEAYAVMDKFLSGVARGAKKDEVLTHEQLHFDVTEALARRLTARLLGFEGRGESAASAMQDLQLQVQRAYDEAVDQLRAYQAQYDAETRHSAARKAQKQWSKKIGELFAAATAELEAAR